MSEKRTSPVDWDAIEPHYRAGVRSLRDIGAEFEVSDAAIIKRAKKMGWTRNLGAKIQAKADAKVAAALVATERADQPAAKLTEAVRVEVESEVQARVRLSHRTDINRAKRLVNRYLAAIESTEIAESLSDTARAALESGTKVSVLTLKEHVGIHKQLVESQKTLVAMEREAYGIAHLQDDPEEGSQLATDPLEGARRIAFALARAANRLSKEQANGAA